MNLTVRMSIHVMGFISNKYREITTMRLDCWFDEVDDLTRWTVWQGGRFNDDDEDDDDEDDDDDDNDSEVIIDDRF